MSPPAPCPPGSRPVILGTAGHIDHGKTRLVQALTGISTDRLPEEQARGISIDLGFAHFNAGPLQFSLVDVPGHERFVRNMVAGATGLDLALLVIAADDGVMPQTREHLDIMQLLGLPAGVIALTKIDLVDPELVPLLLDEVAQLVAGTFLAQAPVIPVSSATGQGLPQLVEALVATALAHPPRDPWPLFRLPIDRVFSVDGHGTVCTGSVWSGSVTAGETLELVPPGISVRVRQVQAHGHSADATQARQRCALNLAGIRPTAIERGMELVTPGSLVPSQRLLCRVQALAGNAAPLKDRLPVRLHLGTAEVPGRLCCGPTPIEPGAAQFAELRLDRPVVAAWGQRFILRRLSPPQTIAGGTILDPLVAPRERRASVAERAARLELAPELRLLDFFARRDLVPESPLPAAQSVGISPPQYPELVASLTRQQLLRPVAGWGLVAEARLAALADTVLDRIRTQVIAAQPRRSLPRQTLFNALQRVAPPPLLEAAWRRLLDTRRLVPVAGCFGPADLQVQLSKPQAALKQAVLERIEQAGLSPPTDRELATDLKARPESLQAILTICHEDGLLIPIGGGLHYTPAQLAQARALCRNALAGGPATVSQLREAWGVSRKYGIPLCEYFDARQLTLRAGDLRQAGPALAAPEPAEFPDAPPPRDSRDTP